MDDVLNTYQWTCQVTDDPVLVRDCLRCAYQRRRPDCPMDYGILRALAHTVDRDETLEVLREAGFPIVRVSSLTACEREAWYKEHDVAGGLEPPKRHWARLRGTIFHRAFDDTGGNGLREKRLLAFLEELGAYVAGKFDHYNPDTAEVTDYKTIALKKTWRKNAYGPGQGGYKTRRLDKPKAHHVEQLKIYAWLLRRNGYPVKNIRIVYVSMGDVQSFDVDPPTGAELDELEATIIERAEAIVAENPPPDEPPSEWLCKYCTFHQCPSNANDDVVPLSAINVTV